MGFWRDLDPRELTRMVVWSKTIRFWCGWRWIDGHVCDDKTVQAGLGYCNRCY